MKLKAIVNNQILIKQVHSFILLSVVIILKIDAKVDKIQ